MSKKKRVDDLSRSEEKKYQDTMLADMGLQSLDDLPSEERRKWKKALQPSSLAKKKLKDMGYSFSDGKNKRSLGSSKSMEARIEALSASLISQKLPLQAEMAERLLKIASIPGIDYPAEEIEVEGVREAIKHLYENPGMVLHLDNPIGTKKWTIDGSKPPLPFHYGEVIEVNNPSDGMGWDVVVAPEASGDSKRTDDGTSYIPYGHRLLPAGYIPINESEHLWKSNTSTEDRPEGKLPPVGNDKIILAPGGMISDADKYEVEHFFGRIWNFGEIVWL